MKHFSVVRDKPSTSKFKINIQPTRTPKDNFTYHGFFEVLGGQRAEPLVKVDKSLW
jgi:hypothetical protein